MKKYVCFPALALVGGASAFVLRLTQNRTGFEASTGLPISGNLWATLLVCLLVLTAAAGLLLARRLPREKEKEPAVFQDAFSTHNVLILTVLTAGLFLLAISGLLEMASGAGLLPDTLILTADGMEARALYRDRAGLILGALTVLSAVCLFPVLPACHRSGLREVSPRSFHTVNGNLLLVPVGASVVRLVMAYRENSVNPSLSAYYIELLALVGLSLSVYRLSSFAFQAGNTRRFTAYAVPTIILCLAALGDSRPLYSTLFFAGNAAMLLGFLLLRLDVLSKINDHI